MRYKNLNDLIASSSGSRKYFLSLPTSVQLELHEQNDYIHSLYDLHSNAEYISKSEYISKPDLR